MLRAVLVFLSLCGLSFQAIADEREAVEKRIKPIGQVQIEGDESTKIKATPAVTKKTTSVNKKMDGETVYKKHCVTCHGAGVAGAPKAHDKAAWATRVKQGLPTLLKHATNGLNAMPPKGTCMECTSADLEAAIKFMLPKK